jgi:MtN3 and saliva related transmembrane protein
MPNKDLIEVLGIIAAICTTSSFVPQAYQIIKTRDTKSISLLMYTVFSIGVFLWLLYGLALNILPVVVANAVTLVLTCVILYFKIREPGGVIKKSELNSPES